MFFLSFCIDKNTVNADFIAIEDVIVVRGRGVRDFSVNIVNIDLTIVCNNFNLDMKREG